jgi:RHS repeat-associated protein
MASVLACPTAELEWVPTDMTKDGAGNIVSKVTETPASGGTVITETRTYNNLNQLTQNVVNTVTQSPYSNTTVTWTLTYDASGNLYTKSDGTNTTTYTWDEDNRLTQVALPGGATVSYTYDSLSRMLTRTDSNGTSQFVWDRDYVTQETDYQGIVTRYYVVRGQIMSFDRQGTAYQVHWDVLGSIRKVTDPSGSVIATCDLDAWGTQLASSSDSIPSGGLAYRFMGALGVRWDAATGVYYVKSRWYDPSMGRFISRERKSTANQYRYALNNPVDYVDSTGNDASSPPPLTGWGRITIVTANGPAKATAAQIAQGDANFADALDLLRQTPVCNTVANLIGSTNFQVVPGKMDGGQMGNTVYLSGSELIQGTVIDALGTIVHELGHEKWPFNAKDPDDPNSEYAARCIEWACLDALKASNPAKYGAAVDAYKQLLTSVGPWLPGPPNYKLPPNDDYPKGCSRPPGFNPGFPCNP